jgi:hypothetical protein
MPEFILDTAGVVSVDTRVSEGRAPGTSHPIVITAWRDLDSFTQGYVEALFFTSTGEDGEAFEQGFSDLAPETLARIIADCTAFRRGEQWQQWLDHAADADIYSEDETAGRDFWYTRNGHGCGFWDGDWPEPYATQLTDAARAFGNVDAYLGDDGRVYL